jgi:hypothetical protein
MQKQNKGKQNSETQEKVINPQTMDGPSFAEIFAQDAILEAKDIAMRLDRADKAGLDDKQKKKILKHHMRID